MCGYQGWFRVPADGSNNGWHHYGKSRRFEPGHCTIDLWPDVRELPAEDQFPTKFKHPDGSVAKVFSSVRPKTVSTHFKWMKDYGIDGVFLQRFAVTTRDPRFRAPMDQVLENCRNAAKEHGRSLALMYDLSGLKPEHINTVFEDWKHLQSKFNLGSTDSDKSYLTHNGRPLIALWGLGFSDRAPMLDEWQSVIRFFKKEARDGGFSIMVGVPTYWRTSRRDAIKDKKLHQILEDVDIISPWTVGRYRTPFDVTNFARETVLPDIAWCKERRIDYLPVSFPGFSWQNLSKSRGESASLNDIPRLKGQFLWSQFWNYKKSGAEMLYVAMFDELDEATAIFKVRSDPPSGKSKFLSEPGLANDHYLWLTGKGGELIRNGPKGFSSSVPLRDEK